MPLIADNPFASLSLIAAPAVLTNASSVLALGTSNRFARAIDRARALSVLLEKEPVTADPMTLMRVHQLNRLERRSLILLHALRAFYLAWGRWRRRRRRAGLRLLAAGRGDAPGGAERRRGGAGGAGALQGLFNGLREGRRSGMSGEGA